MCIRDSQIGFGKLFKELKKELKLDDIEEGNLVNVDDKQKEITEGNLLAVRWNYERKNYYRIL